jgi:hypothetical protein
VVPPEELAAIDRYAATMTYASRALVGHAHAIGIGSPGSPLTLPPPYRTVHVATCASIDDARSLLAPLAKFVVALGSDDASSARALAPTFARVASLGFMQRPPLDGPVDLREG